MSTTTTTHAIASADKLQSLERQLIEVRDHLCAMKHRLDEEIRDYPTPIPRCDAQFNHLFEQRARLNRMLERLEAPAIGADAFELLHEFVASSAYFDEPAEAALRARLGSELSHVGR